MTFNTENRKIQKIWNRTKGNESVIITQQDNNTFIVDNIINLNNLQPNFNILVDFSSEWVVADTLLDVNNEIETNSGQFRIIFNNIPENFIPFIHGEIIYRASENGVIPTNEISGLPFDTTIASLIKKNEIVNIQENSVEYVTSFYMEKTSDNLPEVEYKLVCYLLNPFYMSDQ